jgi:hypothetical protein
MFGELLDSPVDGPTFADAMARSARERHLQVFSAHPEEEAALARLGAAGVFSPEDQAVAVVWDNANDSRTGFFAEKRVSYAATIAPDGSAQVEMRLEIENQAPDGDPSILLGEGDWFRDIDSFVTAYLPPTAASIRITGGDLHNRYRELGRPIAFGRIQTEAGQTAGLSVTYSVPEAAVRTADGWRYRLEIVPQPALRPDLVEVLLRLPDGATLTTLDPLWERPAPGQLRWTGSPTEPVTLSVDYHEGA